MAKTVTVNIDLALAQAQTQGFSTPAILTTDASFTVNRSKIYTSITDVAVDFATTTKEYKAASAIFSQTPTVAKIKFLRQDAGDADITAALDAIFAEDSDWYNLIALNRAEADILEIAAWAEVNKRQYDACSEDAGVYDSAVTTDVLSDLVAANYTYTSYTWHHQGGVDSSTGVIGVILSEVVTVDDVGHGLRVGDPITVSLGADAATNGNFLVATVPTADQFTYLAPGAIDAPAPADAIDYFARYTFPEAAIVGYTAWREVGSYTRKFKTLVGQVSIPTTVINAGQIETILTKGGNVYVEERGLDIYKEGVNASGLFTDNRLGADWLKDTMEASVFTQLKNNDIPYNDAGFGVVENEIRDVLADALNRNVITPYDETNEYLFTMPRFTSATSAERAARTIPAIEITCLIGGFVHFVTINITLTT
jgi:hypothetical protein